MSAENEESPPTTESTTSSLSSLPEAPLLSLMQMTDERLALMTPQELTDFVQEIRKSRSSPQTMRSEVQNGVDHVEKTLKLDLSDYA